MKEIDGLYREYGTLIQSPKYQELLRRMMQEPSVLAMLNPARIQGQIQAEQVAIRSTYSGLREEIPADCEVKAIQQFMAKGEVVTYADMKTLKGQVELLFREANSFKDLLEGKLAFFEGREIHAEGAS